MQIDTVRVYCKQSDCGMSFAYNEFVVHNHIVDLPEDLANDVVFSMPNRFGFAPWPDDQKEETEYSIPEGYEMRDSDFAIPSAEREAFLAEVEKHTVEIAEAEAAEALLTPTE